MSDIVRVGPQVLYSTEKHTDIRRLHLGMQISTDVMGLTKSLSQDSTISKRNGPVSQGDKSEFNRDRTRLVT